MLQFAWLWRDVDVLEGRRYETRCRWQLVLRGVESLLIATFLNGKPPNKLVLACADVYANVVHEYMARATRLHTTLATAARSSSSDANSAKTSAHKPPSCLLYAIKRTNIVWTYRICAINHNKLEFFFSVEVVEWIRTGPLLNFFFFFFFFGAQRTWVRKKFRL